MITSINIDNANLYSVLYTEVSDELNKLITNKGEDYFKKTQSEIEAMNKGYERICATLVTDKHSGDPKYTLCWDSNGNISINSLEAYYGIIEDLVEEKPKYGILPLDEPPFTINANSRLILAPKDFTGVQVQGDHRAEIIYFQINRYFDITDLAEDTLAIYIQWERPDGQRGYSVPCIKDIESKPGYILLGWVLSSSITACPGNVKFSVRFVSANPSSTQELDFSLTTLTSLLEIKNGLVLDFKDEDNLIIETSSARFKNGAMDGSSEAVAPVISKANFNNDDYYFFESNKVNDPFKVNKLKIAAVSPDAGSLNYGWRKSTMSSTENDLSGTVEVSTYTILKDTSGGVPVYTIKDENDTTVDSTLDNFIDQYQCYKTKDEHDIVSDIIDSVDDIIFDEDDQANIYIPFNTYSVNSIGNYYCMIYNKVGLRTAETESPMAHYPGPVDPTTSQTGVVRVGFKKKDDDDTEVETLLEDPTTCDANTEDQIKQRLEYVYEWYYSDTGETYGTNSLGSSRTLTPTAAGYYKSNVKTKLNGVTSTNSVNNIWNVVTAPIPSLLLGGSTPIVADSIIYQQPNQTLQIKINNMDKYDTFSYKVETVDRQDGSVKSVITQGNVPYMDYATNSTVRDTFLILTQPDKCKITCQGHVGSSFSVESDDFVFYIDSQ